MSLIDKNVVITGGNGALGRAVAEVALSQGAGVTLIDINFDDGHKQEVKQIVCDLLDPESTRVTFSSIEPIDALFNIAGGFTMNSSAYEADDDEWENMFAINVSTMRNVIKVVVPQMINQGRGSIVNVGSYSALQGEPDMSAYTAAKSTVMRLTESLSGELKTKGINVNAVLPGIIDTPANRVAMPDTDPAVWVNTTMLGNVICFLGSDLASDIHGALLPVTGLQ